MPSEMEYTKYLNLGFDITTVVCQVTTIFFTFHVIYCSKFDKKSAKLDRISNSFFIFLACRGLGAVIATPYHVYLTAYWSAEGGHYTPYALLWLGLALITHAYLSTLSALLLTLDRCFALTFPMHYNSRMAKWFPWFIEEVRIAKTDICVAELLFDNLSIAKGQIPKAHIQPYIIPRHWLLVYGLYRSAYNLSHTPQCYRLFCLLFVAIDEKNEWVLDKNLSYPASFSSYYRYFPKQAIFPTHHAGNDNATLPEVNSSAAVQTLETPPLEVFHFGVRNETEESNTTTSTTTKGPNEESVIQQLLRKMSPEAGLSQSPYQGR
ncbi:hypothetical protein DdX_19388 [Ditylenchus destructor]|uniref:Uncharacterized protein n=1 Tax=Ditylenchus destructor TaxID=166010 RepID=A0AAD4MKJ1_9BILA|nr:hypothetical protein DdX_19388 [Ditylenchus destructor]